MSDESIGGRVAQDRAGMNVIFVHSRLDDAGLSLAAFRVYCHIARRAGSKEGAYPGIKSVARICDLSENTARRAIAELEARNFLKIIRSQGGRMAHTYFLTAADEWKMAPLQNLKGSKSEPHPFNDCTPPLQNLNPTPSPAAEKGIPSRESNKGNPIKTPETPPQAGGLGLDLPEPPEWLEPAERTPQQITIGLWFKRRASTPWSEPETRAWRKITKRTQPEELAEQIRLLGEYYTAKIPDTARDFRRRDVLTLLNNWPGELDRARNFTPNPTPKNEPERYQPKSWK